MLVVCLKSHAFTPSTSTNIFQSSSSSGDVQPLGSENGDELYNLGLMAPALTNYVNQNGGILPDLKNSTTTNTILNGYLERTFEPNAYGVPAGRAYDIIVNSIYGQFLKNAPQSKIFSTAVPGNLPDPSLLYDSAQFSQVVGYYQTLVRLILKTTDDLNALVEGVFELLNANYGNVSGDIVLFSKTEGFGSVVYVDGNDGQNIGIRTYSGGVATNSTVVLDSDESIAGFDTSSPQVKVEILLDRGALNDAGLYDNGLLKLRITIVPPDLSGITFGDSFVALTMEAPVGFSMGLATIRYLIAISTRGQSQFTFYPEGQGPGETGFGAYDPFEVYALLRAILANDNP
ncbi:MAG TPA: hypothetical protein DIU37_00610 [Opitutae bacterium]|nr:hypothetical protein [Opitutae bacterium]